MILHARWLPSISVRSKSHWTWKISFPSLVLYKFFLEENHRNWFFLRSTGIPKIIFFSCSMKRYRIFTWIRICFSSMKCNLRRFKFNQNLYEHFMKLWCNFLFIRFLFIFYPCAEAMRHHRPNFHFTSCHFQLINTLSTATNVIICNLCNWLRNSARTIRLKYAVLNFPRFSVFARKTSILISIHSW